MLGSQQAGTAKGDDKDKILSQHIGITEGGGHPEGDRGEHIAVYPGRRLIAPSKQVLTYAVKGHHRPYQHHGPDQAVQLSLGANGVFQHDGKQEKGHRQRPNLQGTAPGHREPGPRQIDRRVKIDPAVHGGVIQDAVPVPYKGQQHGGIAHRRQHQH